MNQETKQKKLKICFVSMSAYPLLSGKSSQNVLGPDVIQVLLAKELVNYNYEVVFVTQCEELMPIECIEGVKLINIKKDRYAISIINNGLNIFRTFKAISDTKPHIFMQRGGIPGFYSLFCKFINIRYVCQVASDAFVNRDLIDRPVKEFKLSKFGLVAFGYWLDFKLADAIIVQNDYQLKMLKENFNKHGILIRKPIKIIDRIRSTKAKPPIVLWVGSIAGVKQPELFLKLAEAISSARFQMIGGCSPYNQERFNNLKERSAKLSNLEFLGVVPFHEVDDYFGQASVLVNTSMFEAYPPIAFLQAWMNYMPVVSLGENSDGILCKYNIGFHSRSFRQLVEDVKNLLNNEWLREEMGRNGRLYVEQMHDTKKVINKYVELIDRLGGDS